jgi:protein-S-isoprenylcysteine O-methyltransferase Ste14
VSRLPSLGPRGEGWVVIQFLLLGLVLVAPFVAGGLWDREARWATTLAGGLLALAGLVLAVAGIVHLRSALTPLPHPREGSELVDSGAYRIVRHPIYGGILLGAIGWALLTASPAALVIAGVLGVFFRLKSGREEAWLDARYEGYAAYRARTRRLIPWVY